MPIQAPQWTDYLNCPACCREFSPRRSPISFSCGHTLCKPCIKNLVRKQCPFDSSAISADLEELVVNTALLQLMGYDPPAQPFHPSTIKSLPEQDQRAYDVIIKSLEQLAGFLKYCYTGTVSMVGSRLSRPMQRKLVTLLQCSLMDDEGRGKAARAARSLGERTVSELILQHQNPQQVSANLWAAVRSRGCQFLGPAMQEEVLKLVLLALEDGSPLSRKVLVMFVVQRLEPHFPQASKTSIGHVVQLLYRASCFKVSKRDADSSLMQLKEEFRSYECLRREHDAQIVQIATESGLRIAPDQWSALLYGDTQHKSHMQSIIDKLQTPHSFAQSVQELFFALQRSDDPSQLLIMSISLDRLTNIDPSPDAKSPSWQELSMIMTSLKDVVSELMDYMQRHPAARDANHNLKSLIESTNQLSSIGSLVPGRYKVAMCRDAQANTICPRGSKCTYAHTEEELERYRRQDPSPPTTGPPQIPRQFNYPPPFIDTQYKSPNQQLSPAECQPVIQDNRGMPSKKWLESHHGIPPPNKPIKDWSYAKALQFGNANNLQRPNPNNPVRPTGVVHKPGPISPADRAIRHPAHLIPSNGGIMQHNQDTHLKMNMFGGAAMLPPLNGGMISPLNIRMPPPVNGGLALPYNGGMSSHQFPLPLHGMRYPSPNALALQDSRPAGLNTGYGNGMKTFDDLIEIINNRSTSPKDSRYFPRRQSADELQTQKESTQAGGVSAAQEVDQGESDWEVPEFIPRARANLGLDPLSMDLKKQEYNAVLEPLMSDYQPLPHPRYSPNAGLESILPDYKQITYPKHSPNAGLESILPDYKQNTYPKHSPNAGLEPMSSELKSHEYARYNRCTAAPTGHRNVNTYGLGEQNTFNSSNTWRVDSPPQYEAEPAFKFTPLAQNVPEGARILDLESTADHVTIHGKLYDPRYLYRHNIPEKNSYQPKQPRNTQQYQPAVSNQIRTNIQQDMPRANQMQLGLNKDLYTELATNLLRQQQQSDSHQNIYQQNNQQPAYQPQPYRDTDKYYPSPLTSETTKYKQ